MKTVLIIIESNIPSLKHLNGEFHAEENITVKEFLDILGVLWNHEALVMINDSISKGNEILSEKDKLQLLIPIAGG